MSATITRTTWTDDDGTGTTGTIVNNAEKVSIYDQIDEALTDVDTATTTGTNNDFAYAANGGAIYRWNGASDVTYTGWTNGVAGRSVLFHNITAAKNATFSHQAAGSTAGNRFISATGADLIVPFGQMALVWYDATTARWRVSAIITSAVHTGICDGRLTLTTAVPVTTADVTAAGTIYFTPMGGGQISLYDGSASWATYTFTELSLALTATSGKNYDVFIYNNAGTLTIELSAAWTNDTTRADALTTQNGVLVKSGATTRRYVGTIRASGANTTEDSYAKRFVWNYYNQRTRFMHVLETTNTWTYTTNTWRQANGAAGNQLAFVVGGVVGVGVKSRIKAYASNGTVTQVVNVAVGVDSTTAPTSGNFGIDGRLSTSGTITPMDASYEDYSAIGYHFWAWLEIDTTGSGSTTWYGDNNTPTLIQSGIWGELQG